MNKNLIQRLRNLPSVKLCEEAADALENANQINARLDAVEEKIVEASDRQTVLERRLAVATGKLLRIIDIAGRDE